METLARWLAESEPAAVSWFSASSFCIAKIRAAGKGGMLDKSELLSFCRSLKGSPEWIQDKSWNVPESGLYDRLSRRQWKLRAHEWARQNNASEWIVYVSNSPVERQFWWKKSECVKGAFEGADGVWSYCASGIPRRPRDADLKLRLMQIRDEKDWVQSTLPLGRETFSGFVRHWKKRSHPLEYIAFARVEGLGSIRYIERREGLKPARPDIGNIEIWWKPEPRQPAEKILAEE